MKPRFRAVMTIVWDYDADPNLYPTDDTEEMREIDGRGMVAEPKIIFEAVLDGRAEMVVGVEDITSDEEDDK